MQIETKLNKLYEYMELEQLKALLAKPMDYLTEDVLAIIPSLVMGEDGVSLSRLLVVSQNYLCDVRIEGGKNENFDFADRKALVDIRFKLGVAEIVVEDKVVASYETATVRLLHSDALRTELQYVGSERDAWMAEVREAFPLELLLDRK